jgi:CubicO group peptidase (beta-lactamase class C family)
MIASNSKLFTATALAQLEYNKKLSLDDKITKFFPDYKVYDEHTTALVTIRDMLCHHLGTKTFRVISLSGTPVYRAARSCIKCGF